MLALAGWVTRHQEDRIDYLREENRVLREHLGPRPLRLTDAQRRRLGVRGQKLRRRILSQVADIVTPDTILRWYRCLIAQQYDGIARRRRGRPMTPRILKASVHVSSTTRPGARFPKYRPSWSVRQRFSSTIMPTPLRTHTWLTLLRDRCRYSPWRSPSVPSIEDLTGGRPLHPF